MNNNNIFHFLNIARRETIHSQFLVSVMKADPLFLTMFFNIIGCVGFEVDDKTFKAESEVTLFGKDKATENYGRADIWIGNSVDHGRKRVIVENKIDASDQFQQIYRYRQYLDENGSGRDGMLFYLTLQGKPATVSSSRAHGNKDLVSNNAKTGYKIISFHTHIIPWLEEVKVHIEKANNNEPLYSFINQYIQVVKELTTVQRWLSENRDLSSTPIDQRTEFRAALELHFWTFLADMVSVMDSPIDSRRRYSYEKIYKRQNDINIDNAYGLIIGNIRIQIDNPKQSGQLVFSSGGFNELNEWVVSTSENCQVKSLKCEFVDLKRLTNGKSAESLANEVFQYYLSFKNYAW